MTLEPQLKRTPCGKCQKQFASKAAKKQHDRAVHKPSQAVANSPQRTARIAPRESAEASSSVTPAKIMHRGIAYSGSMSDTRNTIRYQLLKLCHSESRLRKERYHLANSSPAQTRHGASAGAVLPFPEADPNSPKAVAVVIDCEMAGAFGGQNELIQVTVVDFLTGAPLVNKLVNPLVPIQDWREAVTGINATTMQEASAGDGVLQGWPDARAYLWAVVDNKTILIGQSLRNDLQVLRTRHAKIIDTAIVTADAVLGENSRIGKRWGLETLCRELLHVSIRQSSLPGRAATHDSLEDALAARELALLFVQRPDALRCWAKAAKRVFHNGDRTKHRAPSTTYTAASRRNMEDVDDDDSEPLRWEDVIDWEMWPKSPPDSD